MSDKKYINFRFEVHTFIDEDYDENDAPIGVEVIDGLTLDSFTTGLSDRQVRQLGHYIKNSNAGIYTMTEDLGTFMIGNPTTDDT
jgi:hypothetical protein